MGIGVPNFSLFSQHISVFSTNLLIDNLQLFLKPRFKHKPG